ncbi:unnamed protein product [Ilex paraguariensis]|uniref:Uncharacterized protein n=1 Tax=Ilex paraguariensis TaxID=185542 RepID=A0ABC8V1B9_9AQUA
MERIKRGALSSGLGFKDRALGKAAPRGVEAGEGTQSAMVGVGVKAAGEGANKGIRGAVVASEGPSRGANEGAMASAGAGTVAGTWAITGARASTRAWEQVASATT